MRLGSLSRISIISKNYCMNPELTEYRHCFFLYDQQMIFHYRFVQLQIQTHFMDWCLAVSVSEMNNQTLYQTIEPALFLSLKLQTWSVYLPVYRTRMFMIAYKFTWEKNLVVLEWGGEIRQYLELCMAVMAINTQNSIFWSLYFL